MMKHMRDYLVQNGFQYLDAQNKLVLYREKKNQTQVIILDHGSKPIRVEFYEEVETRLNFILSSRSGKPVTFLHIILRENGIFAETDYDLLKHFQNIWFIARDTGKLYIFENQLSDFAGLRDGLEASLVNYQKEKRSKSWFAATPVNTAIIGLNLIYFLVVILWNRSFNAVYDSEIMLKMGALSWDTFMNGAWYQIVTAIFLHFGPMHLGNNMLLLTYTGHELEKRVGGWLYLVLYIMTGLIGNVASLMYYHNQGIYVVSAGASGAIFGVIGALFVLVIAQDVKSATFSPKNLFIMIAISLYHGITSANVDNAAHVGGLLSGLVGGFLLSKISRYGKLE